MKAFLSYARKDREIAGELAEKLREGGFTVWYSEDEIAPGDNWAKRIGKALEEAELMVVLLTPSAFESDRLRQDVDFALLTPRFESRLFTVFVGPTMQAGKDVPWILLKLPHRQVESTRDFKKVVKDLEAMTAGLPANA